MGVSTGRKVDYKATKLNKMSSEMWEAAWYRGRSEGIRIQTDLGSDPDTTSYQLGDFGT